MFNTQIALFKGNFYQKNIISISTHIKPTYPASRLKSSKEVVRLRHDKFYIPSHGTYVPANGTYIPADGTKKISWHNNNNIGYKRHWPPRRGKKYWLRADFLLTNTFAHPTNTQNVIL